MKILGRTITNLLAVLILGSTLVLFISLPITPTAEDTLGGSTSCLLERLRAKKEK
jgi:hypothetical protein